MISADSRSEFAFDIVLLAVARVKAKDEASARSLLLRSLDCVALERQLTDRAGEVLLTEASIDAADASNPHLFEIDGVSVE